jgi:beta-galactosidase
VFTNCDAVRLIVYERDTLIQEAPGEGWNMPHPPITFKDVFSFNSMRTLPYTEKKWEQVSLVAEGLIDGKVVCRTQKMPARRSNKLRLTLDNEGQPLIADGSDFIPVICEVTDDDGNVRRLAKEQILFSIEGEGEIIGDARIGANPRAVEFGSAPVLVRSTLTAGKIRLHARVLFEGENVPSPTYIEWESVPPLHRPIYSEKPTRMQHETANSAFQRKLSEEEKREMLNEVEIQQTDFGEKK